MSQPHAQQFAAPISQRIWESKYRFFDETIEGTWRRIAKHLASCEDDPERYEREFYNALEDFKFLPAGRITAGAGTARDVTLMNCLSGDTLIPTLEYGLTEIGSIAGEVVHVMDGNGKWVPAPINSFGKQPVATVTLRGGYNGRVTKTVSATKGHRWILANGAEEITEYLSIGDELKHVKRRDVNHTTDYFDGVQHGIVYGDGSKNYTNLHGDHSFMVRLCGEKSELVKYFSSEWLVTSPPSCDGDLLVSITGISQNLKSLPTARSVEYMTGFLRGWLATDGCVCARDKRPILSCGYAEYEWLKKYGPISGMEVNYISKLDDETNYGVRNKSIFNVSLMRWTMINADFLRKKHQDAFSEVDYTWSVSGVSEYSDTPEDVYCPRVVTTDSVQLSMGIHTGQCFVMGTIPDSMAGIFDMLKEAALTMQMGGGIGYDFSTLRPKGALVKGVGADSSGPLSFMAVWDAMCRTVMSAGSRRGAMMGTMRCDHPDILAFIKAKRESDALRMFNLSVLITDPFMDAVKSDADWDLVFDGKVYETIKAADLWDAIMQSTYAFAEPGVIFIDRINKANNLSYCEYIAATNPCGEQPLPPYGSCLLGSINLTRFVVDGTIDYDGIRDVVACAVRMMDNVIDVSNFPLDKQAADARNKRRIGLGITGLADMLSMIGVTYGSDDAVAITGMIMSNVTKYAYLASIELAKEKGAFPLLDVEEYLKSDFMLDMPEFIRNDIRQHGIRNALLTSIAPTGTISLYAGNVSSGIEPIFATSYERKILMPDGSHDVEEVVDYAVADWRRGSNEPLPKWFVTAQTLPPLDHVKMQAACQRWVDSAISKTINCPEDISFEDFKGVYMAAWDSGCKGCTTYRPNAITGAVLTASDDATGSDDVSVDGACVWDAETGERSCAD